MPDHGLIKLTSPDPVMYFGTDVISEHDNEKIVCALGGFSEAYAVVDRMKEHWDASFAWYAVTYATRIVNKDVSSTECFTTLVMCGRIIR